MKYTANLSKQIFTSTKFYIYHTTKEADTLDELQIEIIKLKKNGFNLDRVRNNKNGAYIY